MGAAHIYQGSLESIYAKAATSPYADACDREQAAQRVELARALDAKADVLKQYAATQPDSLTYYNSDLVRVELGPAYFFRSEYIEIPKDEWVIDPSYDWGDILAFYTSIREAPVDGDWVRLNRLVRGVAYNDKLRLNGGWTWVLDHNSGRLLKSAIDAIKLCIERKDCAMPELASDEVKLLESHSPLRTAWASIVATADTEQRREKLRSFLNGELSKQYERMYGLTPSSSIYRKSKKTLVVPLDSGAFSGAEREFEKIVASVWNSSRLAIELKWLARAAFPEIFQLVLGAAIGERPFVSYTSKTLNLFNGNRITSVAHEFGHVLGFPDRYYTVWAADVCSYYSESNASDVMSDSSLGTPRAQDWDTLLESYPYAKTAHAK